MFAVYGPQEPNPTIARKTAKPMRTIILAYYADHHLSLHTLYLPSGITVRYHSNCEITLILRRQETDWEKGTDMRSECFLSQYFANVIPMIRMSFSYRSTPR